MTHQPELLKLQAARGTHFTDGETEGKSQGAATDCMRLRLSPTPGWPIPLPGDRSTAYPGPLPLLQVILVAGPLVARVAQGHPFISSIGYKGE